MKNENQKEELVDEDHRGGGEQASLGLPKRETAVAPLTTHSPNNSSIHHFKIFQFKTVNSFSFIHLAWRAKSRPSKTVAWARDETTTSLPVCPAIPMGNDVMHMIFGCFPSVRRTVA